MSITITPWPPTVPAGTTAQTEHIGGGLGLPEHKGGGPNPGTTINPRYSADKATDASERYMIIRWLDDRGPNWSKEKPISLGQIGPEPMTVKLSKLGIYRSRQWEIVCVSAVPLVVVSVEEEAELLGS